MQITPACQIHWPFLSKDHKQSILKHLFSFKFKNPGKPTYEELGLVPADIS